MEITVTKGARFAFHLLFELNGNSVIEYLSCNEGDVFSNKYRQEALSMLWLRYDINPSIVRFRQPK